MQLDVLSIRPQFATRYIYTLVVIVIILTGLAFLVRSGVFFDKARHAYSIVPGGIGSVQFGPIPTFLVPNAALAPAKRPFFRAGQALARQPWVRAPSSTNARDGLGPKYNARSCMACHLKGGRGPIEAGGKLSVATLVRLSLPGTDPYGRHLPEPTYGHQIQPRSIDVRSALGMESSAKLPGEAIVRVKWQQKRVNYADGSTEELRWPSIEFSFLGYGPLHSETRTGLRHTPPLYGVGLLDLVPNKTLRALADELDQNGDGISGRINIVWDVNKKSNAIGRFGWKANQPNLHQQVAAAFSGDIGITSMLFPGKTPADRIEISDQLLQLAVDFTRALGVPKRRKAHHPLVLLGEQTFTKIGCAACHIPQLKTGYHSDWPELSHQVIGPYSDLLLHDMGEDLSDNRPDFLASGSEWRTPPLWGLGLRRAVSQDTGLLHDGRAKTVAEAILWHGGEASASREAFRKMDIEARRALIAFVRSI